MALFINTIRGGYARMRSFYSAWTNDAPILDHGMRMFYIALILKPQTKFLPCFCFAGANSLDAIPDFDTTSTNAFAWIYKGVEVAGITDCLNENVNQSIVEMMWGCKESSQDHLSESLFDACRESEMAVVWVVRCGGVGWGRIAKVASGLGLVENGIDGQDSYRGLYTLLEKHSEYLNAAMAFAYTSDDIDLASWLQDRGDVDWNECLGCACADNCVWMRNMAVAHGADNWNDSLLLACKGGHFSMARWLYASGSCDNLNARECVRWARESGNVQFLEWIESKCVANL